MKQLGVNMIGNGQQQRHHLGRDQFANFTGLGKPLSQYSQLTARRRSETDFRPISMPWSRAGVMKTLAEPTLTAVSGEKATFKVGGEFNLVTSRTSNVSEDNITGQVTYSNRKARIWHRPRIPAGRALGRAASA